MSVAAIIVAAGRGHRAGTPVPKQFVALAGRSVLARTLEAFLSHPAVDRVQPVINGADRASYDAATAELPRVRRERLRPPVLGGATRQVSVRHGLDALEADAGPEVVLIHDAAR